MTGRELTAADSIRTLTICMNMISTTMTFTMSFSNTITSEKAKA